MNNSLIQNNTGLNIVGLNQMEQMLSLAKIMSTATVTIPKHLKNEGDCLAIIMQSAQWGMNPFSVAQKTFLLNGVLGYESQLVSAIINNNAPIKSRLEYEYYGSWERVIGKTIEKVSQKGHKYRVSNSTPEDEKGVGIIVRATLLNETKPRELKLSLLQVTTRNSTLWAEDPKQQLAYLVAKKWSRLYCPDVILGVYTKDEVEQIVETKTYLTPSIEDAITQLGLQVKKLNDYAYLIGDTFQHSKALKEIGFIYEDEKWTILIDQSISVQTTNQNNSVDVQIIDEITDKVPASSNNQDLQTQQKPKKQSSAVKLFSYLKKDIKLKDKEISSFVNDILGVTKEDTEDIDEILSDLIKLENMVNEFKEVHEISSTNTNTEGDLFSQN